MPLTDLTTTSQRDVLHVCQGYVPYHGVAVQLSMHDDGTSMIDVTSPGLPPVKAVRELAHLLGLPEPADEVWYQVTGNGVTVRCRQPQPSAETALNLGVVRDALGGAS